MTTSVDMLNLPVLPIEWYRGPIDLAALTTELYSVYSEEEECPGKPLTAYGEVRGKKGWVTRRDFEVIEIDTVLSEENTDGPPEEDPHSFLEAVESIYDGNEVHVYTPNKEEYYAIPWEKFEGVSGDLIDAMLFLDPERTIPYTINPRRAIKAFNELAAVGRDFSTGNHGLKSLVHFINQHGFPRDGKRGYMPRSQKGNPLSPGMVYTQARFQAVLAFVCTELWSHMERKDYTAIANMATVKETNETTFLSFKVNMNPIQIDSVPPQGDRVWRIHARNWLYAVVEEQIKTLFVARVPKTENAFTIGVRPGGLHSAMWLHFAEKIYRADNPHEGKKQCKQGGKFHGCGEWYIPDGPEDRSHYCPRCRAKAGAERVARFRSK